MNAHGRSNDRHAGRCLVHFVPRPSFLARYAHGLLAFSIERAAGLWTTAPVAWVRATLPPTAARRAVGSSSTINGDGASPSWFVTVSSLMGCRDPWLVTSGSTCLDYRSTSGRASIKTSGSSRWLSEVAGIIGTGPDVDPVAALTLLNRQLIYYWQRRRGTFGD